MNATPESVTAFAAVMEKLNRREDAPQEIGTAFRYLFQGDTIHRTHSPC